MRFSPKYQQGLSFFNLFLILALIATIVLLVLKIGPIYLNHSKVMSALVAVEKMSELDSMNQYEIRSSLKKRFDMNYVEYVQDEDVTIIKQDGYIRIEISYEVVEKIVGNLSALVQFDEVFESGGE